MSRFDDCLAFALSWEGKWSNDPRDPGGATYCGVVQNTYDDFRDRKCQPRQSVRLMADYELQAIYRHNYWTACRCDELLPPVDLAVFDAAVNVGPGRSVRWLQRAVGAVEDGQFGPKTLAAVRAVDPDVLAQALLEIRRQYYERIGGPFLAGWLNRTDALEKVVEGPERTA